MRKSIFVPMIMLVCCILLAFPAFAETLGESAYFNVSISCDYMTLTGVSYLRTDEYVLLEVMYTTHDSLSETALEALDVMSVYLMPDAHTTAFPGSLRYSLVQASDGAMEMRAGATYIQRAEYQGVASLPEVLYLRPYYKLLGTWGDVIALPLSQATLSIIENEAHLPQPLLSGTPGNG